MKRVLFGLLVAGAVFACGYGESNYTRKDCKVIDVTDEGYIIEDTCGYTWFWDEGDFAEGDTVDMKMNINGTIGDIDDDIIKSVKLVKGGNK